MSESRKTFRYIVIAIPDAVHRVWQSGLPETGVIIILVDWVE